MTGNLRLGRSIIKPYKYINIHQNQLLNFKENFNIDQWTIDLLNNFVIIVINALLVLSINTHKHSNALRKNTVLGSVRNAIGEDQYFGSSLCHETEDRCQEKSHRGITLESNLRAPEPRHAGQKDPKKWQKVDNRPKLMKVSSFPHRQYFSDI